MCVREDDDNDDVGDDVGDDGGDDAGGERARYSSFFIYTH